MSFRLIYILSGLFLFVAAACSTEKNTLINRTYHGTTAKYNGLFNANMLLDQAMVSYRNNLKEDYYNILPITPLPNEEEVMGMYPAIDTAIAKCTKVISRHSMPSAENPSKKKAEYNHWIDENWLAIGRSSYYRRDYDGAMKNFEFIRKFFAKDEANYEATLWIAKSQIEVKDYSAAKVNLDLLDLAVEETEANKKSKSWKFWVKKDKDSKQKKMSRSAKKREKKKKKEEEENAKAEFPERIRLELEKTKAKLALARNENEEAVTHLEEALKHAKKSGDKGRIHFILAQINAKLGSNEKAKYHYGKVLKYNTPFEMNFNARINRAFMGGDGKIKKQLNKMLRDEKNSEYKDQIYYALADIALQEGNKDQGIQYLHKSAFYSTNNPRQKGKSYERLGDLSFSDKNYVNAQKYYDSCAKVIPENYPNAEGIKNKAAKLQDLVVAVETATYEDSVQRIAQLSPDEQEKFAKNLIKKMKEDAEMKKRQEAERMKELQSQAAVNQDQLTGNKSYWNNSKTRASGFDEFRKQWGQRENEDNWRRSDKIVLVQFSETENDTVPLDQKAASAAKEDTLSVESLLANLPFGDSAVAASNERLVAALYDAGVIYKEQLNESKMASDQFEKILARNIKTDYNLMASYQLYKIYEPKDSDKASGHKDYILANYPNSDYANYLRDPDFFIKRKEREKLNEQDYITILDRYNRGLYYPVISKADEVISNEKENPYRAKYMLLKALALGQMSADKQPLIPVLEQVIAEYPGSSEEARAKEMLGIIKNGYSANIEADFSKKSLYKYNEDDKEFLVVIFPAEKEQKNISMAKAAVSDFGKEYFSKNKLIVESKTLGEQQVIVAKHMSEVDAATYINKFKKTKKYLGDMQTAKIFFISRDNLKILFETKKVEEYESFYLENY